MRFFVDNNLSQKLAKGMAAFGEDVIHLKEEFPEETIDTEWLKYVGEEGLVLITRDEAIRRNPAELAALREYKVGAFFLGGKNLDSRGEGIHTMAMAVDDLQQTVDHLKAHDVRLIGEGGPQVFVHPKSTHGILLQLTQKK